MPNNNSIQYDHSHELDGAWGNQWNDYAQAGSVFPINDLLHHLLYSENCVCGPKVEIYKGYPLYIHNSLDGRELLEPKDDE